MKAKSLLSAVLALMLIMPSTALADQSTTQGKTAYKDLNARTEVYAVTQTPGSDYPYYGAKWEPKGGVYYGRTDHGGQVGSGYGLANEAALENESIVSHYYGTNDMTSSYDLQYWSYIYGAALDDGEHGFLVYLNFDGEGNDCARVTSGTFDSRLASDFAYLNTLSCPVFLRIGGEVNVWSTTATPEQYIAAYRHIANLARTYAPNAALVFSPNYSSAYQVDMDSYYPGDAYVDWIGCSLYYNQYHQTLTGQDAFVGVGVYGDPMLNVQQTVNLAALHNRPIMITEGGSSNSHSGNDISAWAAERMQKAYSFLPMVYPQIKAMVASDYGSSWEVTDYTFYDNSVVTAAYNKAVTSNPTLLTSYNGTASYYTKLSAYPTKWTGTVKLAAYTYSSDKLNASMYIDGQWKSAAMDYPYSFTLDTSTLTPGNHTLQIRFSNGAEKTYNFTV